MVLWGYKSYIYNKRDLLCVVFKPLCTKFHHHNAQDDPTVLQHDRVGACDMVNFLTGSYKSEYWWFEIFELFRKLMLTGVLTLILPGSDSQIAIAVLFAMFGFFMYVYCKPYRDPRDNEFAIIAQFAVFLILYIGLVLKMRQLHLDEALAASRETADGIYLEVGLVGFVTFIPLAGISFIILDFLYPLNREVGVIVNPAELAAQESDRIKKIYADKKRVQLQLGVQHSTDSIRSEVIRRSKLKEHDDKFATIRTEQLFFLVYAVVEPCGLFAQDDEIHCELDSHGAIFRIGAEQKIVWLWSEVKHFKGECQADAFKMELFMVL
jgi:hypothetical protein